MTFPVTQKMPAALTGNVTHGWYFLYKAKIFTEVAMRRKRYRRGSRSRLKSGHIFNSRFEEARCCEYLINLIGSKFLRGKPAELFNFASSLLGQKKVISMLECPRTVETHPGLTPSIRQRDAKVCLS